MIRRLFFVLLILILPLQSAWAAVSAYCQHERGSAAQHFGHHAHQHQAGDKDKSGGGSSATFHGDCGLCHLGGIGIVSSSLDVPSFVPASPVVSRESNFILSIFIEGPERPKWAPAA